jgi:cation diffusion facilitator family transporter
MAEKTSTRFSVYAALTGNLLVGLTKFAAAAGTGSSAMLSEGFHSLVDTANEVLLLYGQNRAKAPPDAQHPLGHGRELYFWSFVVAVLIFALGAGLSLYDGLAQILRPTPIRNVTVTYIVYAAAFLIESVTWWIGFKNFRRACGSSPFWQAVRQSKDPPALIVLFEDTADVLGIVIAAVGTAISVALHSPLADGIASLGIGALLALTAALLARESKGLLIGEPADAQTMTLIRETLAKDRAVAKTGNVLTVHLSPDQIFAAATADFKPSIKVGELEKAILRIEREIKARDSRVIALYVKPVAMHAAGAKQSAGTE